MSNKHIFKNSSSVAHCDYDDKTNTMIICFTSGQTYHYPDCHKSYYEGLKTAESPGKYFHAKVRNNLNGVKKE